MWICHKEEGNQFPIDDDDGVMPPWVFEKSLFQNFVFIFRAGRNWTQKHKLSFNGRENFSQKLPNRYSTAELLISLESGLNDQLIRDRKIISGKYFPSHWIEIIFWLEKPFGLDEVDVFFAFSSLSGRYVTVSYEHVDNKSCQSQGFLRTLV